VELTRRAAHHVQQYRLIWSTAPSSNLEPDYFDRILPHLKGALYGFPPEGDVEQAPGSIITLPRRPCSPVGRNRRLRHLQSGLGPAHPVDAVEVGRHACGHTLRARLRSAK